MALRKETAEVPQAAQRLELTRLEPHLPALFGAVVTGIAGLVLTCGNLFVVLMSWIFPPNLPPDSELSLSYTTMDDVVTFAASAAVSAGMVYLGLLILANIYNLFASRFGGLVLEFRPAASGSRFFTTRRRRKAEARPDASEASSKETSSSEEQ